MDRQGSLAFSNRASVRNSANQNTKRADRPIGQPPKQLTLVRLHFCKQELRQTGFVGFLRRPAVEHAAIASNNIEQINQ
ncbi:hypothetical protein LP415_19310 [Polaromonas sp. P1(28)-8]|nr:hypothetical protein LP415_19310 [Polaromonas sp. P1(28)-8]